MQFCLSPRNQTARAGCSLIDTAASRLWAPPGREGRERADATRTATAVHPDLPPGHTEPKQSID